MKLRQHGWAFPCALLLAMAAALAFGGTRLPWEKGLRWLWTLDPQDTTRQIFFQLRLPRVVAAALVGALLAGAGSVLQGSFRNPLADPYLLGLSGGAALGATAAMALGWPVPGVWACLGAGLSLGAVLLLARFNGRLSVPVFLLAGAAVHSLSSALLTFFLARWADHTGKMGAFFWLMGSLESWPWSRLIPLSVAAGFTLLGIMALAPSLNLLSQGDETASSLGLPVESLKWVVILISATATGLAVTLNGLLPFVGLVAPHAARLLTGADHRKNIPATLFCGATLAVLADMVGRSFWAPREIPAGVVTSLIGAPFFLILLRSERKSLG